MASNIENNLFLFPTGFCLFKTSDHKNFLALRICPLTNLSLWLISFNHTSDSLHCLSKIAFSEHIPLKHKAWLKAIGFLQWETWSEFSLPNVNSFGQILQWFVSNSPTSLIEYKLSINLKIIIHPLNFIKMLEETIKK